MQPFFGLVYRNFDSSKRFGKNNFSYFRFGMFGNRIKVKMFKLLLKFLVPTAKPSDECVFPFKYRGKTYDKCTKVRHNQLWCSKDAVYKGRWKNCKGLCEMKCFLFYGFSHHKRCFIDSQCLNLAKNGSELFIMYN